MARKNSPFDKYGRRKITRLNVDEQKRTHQSNAAEGLRIGQAVGSIGTQIGDAIDENKKDKKKDEPVIDQEQITQDAYDFQEEEDANDLEADILGMEEDEPGFVEEVPDEAYIDDFDDGGVHNINKGSGANDGGGAKPANGNPYKPLPEGIKPFYGPDSNALQNVKPGSNPNNDGGGQGGFDLSPLTEGISKWWDEVDLNPFDRRRDQASAFKRENSPYNATQYDPNTGTPIGEGYIQRAKAPSYLGEIGAAGAEGYNRAADRYNYKRQVWEVKQNELDQQFGDLEVEPSGNAPFDASVETMAKQWQQELVDLQNNKGSIDPGEFTARKHEILGRSKTYKAASESIQQLLTDYAADKDNISTSTKPEILDLIETLTQGGDVRVINDPESGQPILAGRTINNKRISVPLADIANGKNAFRYNKKVDVTKPLADISKGLAGLKRDYEQAGGRVLRGPQAWEMVKGSASAQLDNMLANEATVRSVAADRFNIDYDAWTDLGSDAAKAKVKDLLMQEIEKQYAPAETAQTVVRSGTQQRAAKRKFPQEITTGIQSLGSNLNIFDAAGKQKINSILARSGAVIGQGRNGKWGLVVNNKPAIPLPEDPKAALETLMNYLKQ